MLWVINYINQQQEAAQNPNVSFLSNSQSAAQSDYQDGQATEETTDAVFEDEGVIEQLVTPSQGLLPPTRTENLAPDPSAIFGLLFSSALSTDDKEDE